MGFSLFESENDEVKKGNSLYRDQEFTDSLIHYNNAVDELGDLPELQYNRGSALYKQEKLDEAMEAFLKTLNKADDPLKAKVYYNMGNLLLKQGKLEEAIDSYKRSLKLVPGDRDVIFNLELAQRMLEKAKEEQKKQQQENKDQEQSDQE